MPNARPSGTSRTEKTGDDLFVLPMEGNRKAAVFLQTAADEGNGTFSPGHDWIAYESDEAGGTEILCGALSCERVEGSDLFGRRHRSAMVARRQRAVLSGPTASRGRVGDAGRDVRTRSGANAVRERPLRRYLRAVR